MAPQRDQRGSGRCYYSQLHFEVTQAPRGRAKYRRKQAQLTLQGDRAGKQSEGQGWAAPLPVPGPPVLAPDPISCHYSTIQDGSARHWGPGDLGFALSHHRSAGFAKKSKFTVRLTPGSNEPSARTVKAHVHVHVHVQFTHRASALRSFFGAHLFVISHSNLTSFMMSFLTPWKILSSESETVEEINHSRGGNKLPGSDN